MWSRWSLRTHRHRESGHRNEYTAAVSFFSDVISVSLKLDSGVLQCVFREG